MRPGIDGDRVAEVLGRALELPPAERSAWLARECGGDRALRSEVESLLAFAGGTPDYLDGLRRELAGLAARAVLAEDDDRDGDPWVPREIGPYRVLERIGRGGSAVVYRARDEKHGREVAIKVLRRELAATLAAERFTREIAIAARLSHPHILPLFDSGEHDGFLYYVMPFVEGESLRERLAREVALSVPEAIRIAEQVGSALAYAHERGIVHRDIKPENILLAGDQAIVADFGIARAVEAARDERLTGTGLMVGTPAYMSPEQALGSDKVDARTDVYALGCVVYEMLSGRAPFPSLVPGRGGARRGMPGLRTLNPAAPRGVDRAVRRALADDPADRFPTVAAFAQALTSGAPVARPLPRRVRRQAVRIGAGLVVLAAGWGVVSSVGGAEIRRVGVLPLTNLTNDPAQEYLVEGVHEALIAELAQLGIQVIARTTMRQYEDSGRPIAEIAREIGVDALIEGSVFRAGDSLEIAARLYGDDGRRVIWSGAYDGTLPNVVALYRGFARAIADRIEFELSPEAEARLAAASPIDPEVYEAYLRGMYYLNRSAPEDFERALGYFEEAVERNPADARAYAGLALAYVTLGHGAAPPVGAWQNARAAAERAIRLDSTLAEAWAALADVKTYFEWDWENAERAFRRADALNPGLAMNHYHHAWYLVMHGRTEEALEAHRRAQELDPLTPLHAVWAPGVYLYAGRYREALREARRLIPNYPDHASLLFVLGTAAAQLGAFDEAIAAHEKMVSINPRWRFALGRTYALAGRTEEALAILAELEAEPPTAWGAIGLADLHTALGNHDEAFRWLAFEPAHGWLPWSRVNPALVPLRGDPRFQALMQRLRLPMPER